MGRCTWGALEWAAAMEIVEDDRTRRYLAALRDHAIFGVNAEEVVLVVSNDAPKDLGPLLVLMPPPSIASSLHKASCGGAS